MTGNSFLKLMNAQLFEGSCEQMTVLKIMLEERERNTILEKLLTNIYLIRFTAY